MSTLDQTSFECDAPSRYRFGTLADGRCVEAVELINVHGRLARVITLGASLQSLLMPDRHGALADVVLGLATPAEYERAGHYFGASIGRCANRIAAGDVVLDGRPHKLSRNDGANHLHGGVCGLDKAVWEIESLETGVPRVVLAHTSPAGTSGYPGTLRVTASYSLSDADELTVEYRAVTDAPTLVNLTHHSYFNLAGEDSARDVLQHRLWIDADAFTPVDDGLIPTGELRPVAGTVFDFRSACTLSRGARDAREPQIRLARGYDHNFVLNDHGSRQRAVARLEEPASGRVLELLTSAPGLQLYSGNFLDGRTLGKSGRLYRQGDGLCLEPQAFPDAPHHAHFPSVRLDPGQIYINTMTFRFLTSTEVTS